MHFHPKTEVVLNIDNDHLDYFKNMDNVKNAFVKYVKLLPYDGLLVYNADDVNSTNLATYTKAKAVSFAINNSSADFVSKNIKFDKNGFASFDVYKDGVFYFGYA